MRMRRLRSSALLDVAECLKSLPEPAVFHLSLPACRGLAVALGLGPVALGFGVFRSLDLLGEGAKIDLGYWVEPAQLSVLPADVQPQDFAVTASVPLVAALHDPQSELVPHAVENVRRIELRSVR